MFISRSLIYPQFHIGYLIYKLSKKKKEKIMDESKIEVEENKLGYGAVHQVFYQENSNDYFYIFSGEKFK